MKWQHKIVNLADLDKELEAMHGQYIHTLQLVGTASEPQVFIASYLMGKQKFKKSWKNKKAE